MTTNNPPDQALPWPQPNPQPQPATPATPNRMSTDRARRRAGLLKRWALAGSVLAFCGLTGLAASHLTGVTSAAAGSPGTSVTAPENDDDDGGFFPANNGQSSDEGHHDGGFNFGSGGSFQPPATSSGGS
ncbi:MAG TPA: hypothetical protein VFU63_08535 [Ktedonobacterales bacterium]|nr:hypothetical protein [Ktedonobacterales bacterium]